MKVRAPCPKSQGRRASEITFKERKFQTINTTGVGWILKKHVVGARPVSQHIPMRMSCLEGKVEWGLGAFSSSMGSQII